MSKELYFTIALSWIGIAVVTFVYLFKQTAPYGRHSNERWGPMIDNRWGWFIMEVFVLVILAYFLWDAKKQLKVE
ncbi:MAG: hypothetical protein ACO28O_07220 [Crocinitomicaceae bacterium]